MYALDGIKILDLTRNTPGEFCTMMLGDLGADVLKVERPMDSARTAFERSSTGASNWGQVSKDLQYSAMHRNKRSIALNLKHKEAQDIFYSLAKDADVVIEGFRPGVVDRLGVGYETINEINPRIVYLSLSGYGQDGPYKLMAGHDINYISLAGALDFVGYDPNDKPAIPMNYIADYAGGSLCSAVAILAAIIAREKTGRGQYIDIGMAEGAFYLMAGLIARHQTYGEIPVRGRNRLNGGYPHYNVYETKDGEYISIAALEPWFWENLCNYLERPDLIPHQHTEGEKRQEVFQLLTDTFKTRTMDEWFEELKDKDICVGKVYSIDEAMQDPHLVERGMVLEVEGPEGEKIVQPASSLHMSDTPPGFRNLGPTVGQHTKEILAGMGYSDSLIQEMLDKEIIQ